MLGLFLRGVVAVDDADSPHQRHRDRHFPLRYSIHRRRDQRRLKIKSFTAGKAVLQFRYPFIYNYLSTKVKL